MTEARHDQAVALLTGTSPTIALLVEREQAAPGGSPGQSRARAHSPPPPEPSDSPDQEDPTDERLSPQGNHLSQPLEDEYPIEVRLDGRDEFSVEVGRDEGQDLWGRQARWVGRQIGRASCRERVSSPV